MIPPGGVFGVYVDSGLVCVSSGYLVGPMGLRLLSRSFTPSRPYGPSMVSLDLRGSPLGLWLRSGALRAVCGSSGAPLWLSVPICAHLGVSGPSCSSLGALTASCGLAWAFLVPLCGHPWAALQCLSSMLSMALEVCPLPHVFYMFPFTFRYGKKFSLGRKPL